ncbi:MAG: M3 family peptidase, partial [Chryseobacterium sp.]
MNNILTEKFNTPLSAAPFDKISNDQFLPAFKELISESEKEIDEIAENNEAPSFENTIEALAYSGEKLDVLSNIFFNLNSAETSDELQQIAQEISPLLTEFSSKISQNEQLFSRIKTVHDSSDNLQLNGEQKMLLEETYKGFVRSGALLNDEDKDRLKTINRELSLKSLQFGQNALASTNAYFKHITDKEALRGIPEAILQQYA